jgi:hypothetical protein
MRTFDLGEVIAERRLTFQAAATGPEPLILGFVRLVNDLPPPVREIWNRASRRVFDIGMQSSRRPFQETHRLAPATLRAAADVDAEIAVTVYALLSEDDI